MNLKWNNSNSVYVSLRLQAVPFKHPLFSVSWLLYPLSPSLLLYWAVLERDKRPMNYGLRVLSTGGKIDFKRYHIGNGYVKEYIFLRILLAAQKADEVSESMSKDQQDKIIQYTLKDRHLRNSELANLLVQMGMAHND